MKTSEIETIKKELKNLTNIPSYKRVPRIERGAQLYYLFIKLSKSNLNIDKNISERYFRDLIEEEHHLGIVLIKGIERQDKYCDILVILSLYLLYGQPNLNKLLSKEQKIECEEKALEQKRILFNQVKDL